MNGMRYSSRITLTAAALVGLIGCSANDEIAAPSVQDVGGITVAYDYLALGTLGGSESFAVDVNDAGTVVGFSTISPGSDTYHAFSWTSSGGLRDLGTLPAGTNSRATGVNRQGDIVGLSDGASGLRAVLWLRRGGPVDLGAAARGDVSINDRGQVVWAAPGATPEASPRIMLWTRGRVEDLGAPTSDAFAVSTGISNRGVVLAQPHHVWSRSGGWQPLQLLPGTEGFTSPWDLNDLGDVVGENGYRFDEFNLFPRGVWWRSGGEAADLGDQFVPRAVSNGGTMAGMSGLGYAEPIYPTWRPMDGEVAPLPSPDGNALSFGAALGINGRNDIVGYSQTFDDGAIIQATLWRATTSSDVGGRPRSRPRVAARAAATAIGRSVPASICSVDRLGLPASVCSGGSR